MQLVLNVNKIIDFSALYPIIPVVEGNLVTPMIGSKNKLFQPSASSETKNHYKRRPKERWKWGYKSGTKNDVLENTMAVVSEAKEQI